MDDTNGRYVGVLLLSGSQITLINIQPILFQDVVDAEVTLPVAEHARLQLEAFKSRLPVQEQLPIQYLVFDWWKLFQNLDGHFLFVRVLPENTLVVQCFHDLFNQTGRFIIIF